MTQTRVQETSTSTGTSTFTLAGAVTNYSTFNSAVGTNRRFKYVIVHESVAEWEHGLGYLSASTTLVREQVRQNHLGTSATVNFSAGTKNVFIGVTDQSFLRPPHGYVNAGSRGVVSGHVSTGAAAAGTQATGSNKLRLHPFILEVPLIVTGMRIEITTAAASSKARMAIYEVKGNGLPGYNLFETGDVDTSTTGFKTGTGTPKYFQPGVYWVGCGGDNATVAFRRYLSGAFKPSIVGANSANSSSESGIIVDLTAGWTTLPAADPNAATVTDGTGLLYLTLVGDVV